MFEYKFKSFYEVLENHAKNRPNSIALFDEDR